MEILSTVSRPIFFTGNKSGSEIAGNGTGTRINGYTKMNKYERKYNKNGQESGLYTRMHDTFQKYEYRC
jgi:hypothetical protein